MGQSRTLKVALMVLLIFLLTSCAQITPSAPAVLASATQSPPKGLESGLQEIGGVVLGGGDTTAPGLMDAPRTFAFQVKTDNGEEITVTYTAYPPSPAGDSQPAVELSFYAGEILVGDYLSARGTYDQSAKTLTVANQGDYIKTFAEKP